MIFRRNRPDDKPSDAALWGSVSRTLLGVPEVTPAQVAAALGRPELGRLVDVREPHEFDGPLGHIQGAELVPLGRVAAAASSWDPAAPVIVYCRSGGRSGRAAKALERAGFSQVASMAGGMQRWSAERLCERLV